jgi:hypothetical protein
MNAIEGEIPVRQCTQSCGEYSEFLSLGDPAVVMDSPSNTAHFRRVASDRWSGKSKRPKDSEGVSRRQALTVSDFLDSILYI